MISLRCDTFSFLLPFDQSAPMGWGLDFVWPRQLEARGLRLGIIDAVPLRHSLRKPVAHYDYDDTNQAMSAFLSSHEHVERQKAFVALESFPLIEDVEQAAGSDEKTSDAHH